MLAYHGDAKIKEDILAQLQAHYEADEIVKGVYWQHGKGCAVGCTIHSGNHIEYESRFGIPVQLAYLEDNIFESLPNEKAKEWPLQFMQAIPVGADLSHVIRHFVIAILSDDTHGVLRLTQEGTPQHTAIANVITLLQDNCQNHKTWVEAAEAAAEAAAWAVRAAAEAAAWAAWAAEVAEAAEAAAWAAWAAEVAEAAEAAAWAAYASAEEAAQEARAEAHAAHYAWMADTLIQLLKEAA